MYAIGLTSTVDSSLTLEHELLEAYIADIAKEDKTALAQLYEHTKAAVYGFSLSILKDTHDGEDVLQETYLHIYRSAGNYVPQGKPMAWIFTIARNLSLMKLRRRGNQISLTDEALEYCPAEPEKFSSEDRLILNAALKELSGEESQIIMLHAIWGFKHREISSLLELPLSTVLSKYNRAIKKLGKILREGYSNGK